MRHWRRATFSDVCDRHVHSVATCDSCAHRYLLKMWQPRTLLDSFSVSQKQPPTANTHCLFKRHRAADNNAKCVGRSVPDANPCNYNSGFWNSATPEPEENVKILAYEFHTREPTMPQRTGTRMTDPKHDRDATWLMSTLGDGNAKHAEEARLVFRSPKRSWLFRRHCDAVTRNASTTTVQNPCEKNSKKWCLTLSRALIAPGKTT